METTKTWDAIKMAHLLIEKSERYGDVDMYWAACDLIGQSAVVKYKLQNEIELDDLDREFIYQKI